ncbi:MAG: ComF family protein [Halioglobus sp.]|jgi:ComF family protein
MAFLIHRWKFQGEKQLTVVLANLWLSTWENSRHIDLIVPVPLHWRRLWHRGFNQAELLARKIHAIAPDLHNTDIDVKRVTRTRATESQSGLSATGRGDNLNGVFDSKKKCEGMHIAVVDDVMTTGSTAEALSKCLLKAGAKSVEIWCIARTPAPLQ